MDSHSYYLPPACKLSENLDAHLQNLTTHKVVHRTLLTLEDGKSKASYAAVVGQASNDLTAAMTTQHVQQSTGYFLDLGVGKSFTISHLSLFFRSLVTDELLRANL